MNTTIIDGLMIALRSRLSMTLKVSDVGEGAGASA